jgi:hypothetical protein
MQRLDGQALTFEAECDAVFTMPHRTALDA